MSEKAISIAKFDSHLECFGEFQPEDKMCRQFCALRLRCVIARDRSFRLGLLEELISNEIMDLTVQ